MRKVTMRSLWVVLSAGLLIMTSGMSQANAQTNSGNGLQLSPVRTDLVIESGKSATISINVRNPSKVETQYRAIVNDFVADKNENGQASLILDDDKFAPSHSLKRYIAPIANITIPAGSSKEVKVSINMPSDVAAGGYYGAVRFAAVNGSGKDSNVALSASVGSLILVKVPGDVKENLVLESFDVRTSEQAPSGSAIFTTNKNLRVVARFKNTGNVHEQPFGKVIVKKGTKVVQSTEINDTDPKANVLPDSTRRFAVKLNKLSSFGKYTVEGNFGYGANGQLISGKTSFMVVPMALIILGIALLALLIFAIFAVPRAIRRYNASVVRKANRR